MNKDKVLWKLCHPAHDYSKLQYAFTFIQTWKGKNERNELDGSASKFHKHQMNAIMNILPQHTCGIREKPYMNIR